MALERPNIEKKDFPVGRRGYDPAAVDAHLSMIAVEVEAITRSSRPRTETLAEAASVQVRTIVEAAEKTAADIQSQAEQEARQIRGDASKDAKREREEAARDARKEREQAAAEAQSEREQAATQAREYVGHVSESTSQMLKRLDAMEGELGALTESLRTGANRLTAELELLESEMGKLTSTTASQEVRAETGGAVRWPPTSAAAQEHEPVVEPEAVAEPEPLLEAEPEALTEREPEPETAVAEPVEEAPEPAPEAEEAEAPAADGAAADDTEGARLIALNMALNGTPREETDRYLAENFQLSDRGQLLDEVYASVEG